MAEENQDKLSQQEQQAIDLGAATTRTSQGTIYTLTIVGQIEGHQVLPETVKTTKYEHVLPLLAAVEESEDIDGLLLLLNTVGGDIEAGLAAVIFRSAAPLHLIAPLCHIAQAQVCALQHALKIGRLHILLEHQLLFARELAVCRL